MGLEREVPREKLQLPNEAIRDGFQLKIQGDLCCYGPNQFKKKVSLLLLFLLVSFGILRSNFRIIYLFIFNGFNCKLQLNELCISCNYTASVCCCLLQKWIVKLLILLEQIFQKQGFQCIKELNININWIYQIIFINKVLFWSKNQYTNK